jgi:hypothetical protein
MNEATDKAIKEDSILCVGHAEELQEDFHTEVALYKVMQHFIINLGEKSVNYQIQSNPVKSTSHSISNQQSSCNDHLGFQ